MRTAALGLVLLMLLAAGAEPAAAQGPAAVPGDSSDWVSFKADYAAARTAPRPVFERYLPRLGAQALLRFLDETYPACHAESHELGRAIFAASGDLETALDQCGTGCTSGCMHGAVTEALGGSSLDQVARTMNRFCVSGVMTRLHKPGNCAHGLGHALMFLTGGDVRRSVDGCLGFTHDAMKYYCATGVYMEKIMTPTPPPMATASLHRLCDQERLFPGACYRYNSARLVYWFGDRTRVALECLRLEGAWRRGCFQGLGYTWLEAEPDQAVAACTSRGDRDDKVACLEGLIEKLADLDRDKASRACENLGGELRRVCDTAAGRQMYSLDKPTLTLYYDPAAVHSRAASATPEAAPQPSHHH